MVANERPRFEIDVVRLEVRVVASLASSELEPQLIDNRSRDLVLNRKDILQLAIETVGPEWRIVRHANELRVDPEPPLCTEN